MSVSWNYEHAVVIESTSRRHDEIHARVSEVELRQNCFWARDADDKSQHILEWNQIIEVILVLPKDKIILKLENISAFVFKLPTGSAVEVYKAMFEESKLLKALPRRLSHRLNNVHAFKPTNGQEDEDVEMIEMEVLGDGDNEEPEEPEISEFDLAADVQAVVEDLIKKVVKKESKMEKDIDDFIYFPLCDYHYY